MILIAITAITIFSCHVHSNQVYPSLDLYRNFPIGTALTEDLLSKAEQIFPYSKGTIILLNNSTNQFEKDHHLLFFDEENKLESACFAPKTGVTKLEHGILTFFEPPYYEERKLHRRNELPKGIKIKLINPLSGEWAVKNKIIRNIEIENNDLSKIKIIYSQGFGNYYRSIQEIESDLYRNDSITVDMKEFRRTEKTLYLIDFNANKELEFKNDHFVFSSQLQKKEFDASLFQILINQSTKN